MKHEEVSMMFKGYHARKRSGVVRPSLHTFKELCDELNVSKTFMQVALRDKNGPKPIMTRSTVQGTKRYYNRGEFIAWFKTLEVQHG